MTDPVYAGDGIELYAGRCEWIMPALTPIFDLVIADLPYQTTRQTWDRMIDPKILWSCWRPLTRDRTPIMVFGTGLFTARMKLSNEADFRFDLVWDKEAVSGHLNAKRQPLRAHEDIIVFYRAQPSYEPQMVYTGRSSHSRGTRKDRTVNHYGAFHNTDVVEQDGFQYPRSILSFKRPKLPAGMGHPNQKPVALLEWMIKTYTKPGDVVLDPVAGVSSTLVAARNCGRRAIGIELHDEFIEKGVARLASGSEEDRW